MQTLRIAEVFHRPLASVSLRGMKNGVVGNLPRNRSCRGRIAEAMQLPNYYLASPLCCEGIELFCHRAVLSGLFPSLHASLPVVEKADR